jgi:tRNA pseudouridine32 synthase / 23S rRNA pseudouridine746 synthase
MLLYRDDQILVFDKPSGLLTQPGRGPDLQDCLLTRVQHEHPTARIVHRLDRDTSGLIVLALDADTHRELSRQFEAREVEKKYVAVAFGVMPDDHGQIDHPLRKDLDHPPRHMVDSALGKSAVTEYRVIQRLMDRTRIELTPLTGRSHQIRVHLQHIGHPVLGDPLYAHEAALRVAERLLLHATELNFTHPQSHEPMRFECACPF